jgi:peptidoglycan hydrolase-like protein with peptidoglycan-binding domain
VFGPAETDPTLLGKPAIASMQAALAQLGYDPGPIDGVFGPRTSAAIRAFQHAEELLADGTLSAVTRARLAARGGGM